MSLAEIIAYLQRITLAEACLFALLAVVVSTVLWIMVNATTGDTFAQLEEDAKGFDPFDHRRQLPPDDLQ